MTNEDLALRIKAGESHLQETLWLNIYGIVCLRANNYYNQKRDSCIASNVEFEDLIQVGYFAMMKAVKSYTKESGYKFNTFLSYPLTNEFNLLTGLNRVSKSKEPNRYAICLDAPVGEDDFTIGDTLSDSMAEQEYEKIVDNLYTEQLSQTLDFCLAKLTSGQAKSLKDYYYHDTTINNIANARGVTKAVIWKQIQCGFKHLRKPENLNHLKSYMC